MASISTLGVSHTNLGGRDLERRRRSATKHPEGECRQRCWQEVDETHEIRRMRDGSNLPTGYGVV